MKKLLLLALLISTLKLSAQTEKGKIFLSGATNASLLLSIVPNSNIQNNFNINIAPSIGYFIANDFTMGLSFSFSYLEGSSSLYKYKSTTYQIAPFARYYFSKPNTITRLYAQANAGIVNIDSQYGTGLTGQLGIAIFSNQHVSLDIAALYSATYNKTNFNSTLGINFGISVYLGKTKDKK